MFDNTKIKQAVPGWAARIPFNRGSEEILNWFLADPARQKVDPALNELMDRMIAAYESSLPRV